MAFKVLKVAAFTGRWDLNKPAQNTFDKPTTARDSPNNKSASQITGGGRRCARSHLNENLGCTASISRDTSKQSRNDTHNSIIARVPMNSQAHLYRPVPSKLSDASNQSVPIKNWPYSDYLYSNYWTWPIVSATDSDLPQFELPAMESQTKKKTVEPLLRFPFIHSLANPCGFALNSTSSFPTIQSWLTERHVNHFETTPAPLGSLRTVDLSGETTLAQQSLAFLIPFRVVLSAPNGPRYSGVKYSSEDQRSLTEELKLVVSEAGHLVRRIYAPSGLHKCGGFQLQSLPQEDLIVSPAGHIQLEQVYRTLMIFSTHLHLMIRDAYESTRFCPSENYVRLQNIQQLTGKVETSMCLILHSALVTENCDDVNYFRVTRQILQSYVHRYYDCSAREIRRCLVFRYGDRILNLLERHIRS